jgi:hypothetical protein
MFDVLVRSCHSLLFDLRVGVDIWRRCKLNAIPMKNATYILPSAVRENAHP